MPLTIESAARKDKRNATGATFEHRHFAAIANIIDSCSVGCDKYGDDIERARYALLDEIAGNLCAAFAQSNPRFDRARFLAACGF